jgi:hypothetical protein
MADESIEVVSLHLLLYSRALLVFIEKIFEKRHLIETMKMEVSCIYMEGGHIIQVEFRHQLSAATGRNN